MRGDRRHSRILPRNHSLLPKAGQTWSKAHAAEAARAVWVARAVGMAEVMVAVAVRAAVAMVAARAAATGWEAAAREEATQVEQVEVELVVQAGWMAAAALSMEAVTGRRKRPYGAATLRRSDCRARSRRQRMPCCRTGRHYRPPGRSSHRDTCKCPPKRRRLAHSQ